MSFFADLTPYVYGGTEPSCRVVNIGWLSTDHPFSRAEPDARFVRALRKLAAAPVNLYRGAHMCDICPAPCVRSTEQALRMIDPRPGTWGNGEIRISDGSGTTYVAPTLIVHYVIEHHYAPPAEFVRAVLAQDEGP